MNRRKKSGTAKAKGKSSVYLYVTVFEMKLVTTLVMVILRMFVGFVGIEEFMMQLRL